MKRILYFILLILGFLIILGAIIELFTGGNAIQIVSGFIVGVILLFIVKKLKKKKIKNY